MDAVALLSQMPTPERVGALEQQMLALPQVDLKTSHVLHGGMCVRTIFIPAGTTLTGALTNIDNVCVVQGDISVTTDEGVKRLQGFNVIPAGAGFKRAGYAHADTWWSTVWKTDLSDLAKIEEEMTSEASKLQTRTLAVEHQEAAACLSQ
ncbi:MAG TPA: hypothetical protein PLN91_02960 [Rhodanobacteraceae bacterium]|nr:hypothetical protein [Rhodanobacteraceae bacterium]